MGTFQITYDDFSGGQYMGNKSTNLPKNTWTGKNIICAPDGQLMPSQPLELSRYQTGLTSTFATIADHWIIGADSFVFTRWGTTPGSATMTVHSNIYNGTTAPTAPTVFPLTYLGTPLLILGQVAYAQIPGSVLNGFFFAHLGKIYRIDNPSGAVTLISSALSDASNVMLYGYRLFAWSGTRFLYYSDTDMITWSASQYYEFNSPIRNVVARTNDLLVFTDGGVYSVVGVPGSSVTIQLIVPELNVMEGMDKAVVVNRKAYFLDDSRNSFYFSGRIHVLNGATVQTAYQILNSDTVAVSKKGITYEIGHFNVAPNGQLALQLTNGYFYIETTPGQWSRFYSSRNDYTTNTASNQQRIGKPGPTAPDELCLVASISTDSPFSASDPGLVLTRYLHNIPAIENVDTGFSTSLLGVTTPTGTVTLSEYWHSKPYTVKEVFVEFFARTGYTPAITVGITPTGIIDLYSADNGGALVEASQPLTVGTANTNNASITQRYRVNNAAKGFGATTYLTITNATIKRVILNCED
jgi:hypothetical protein